MKRLSILWLSGMGLGYFPFAPATWGSLLGVGLAYIFSFLPWVPRAALIISGWVISAWLFLNLLGKNPPDPDPSWVVADEYWALAALTLVITLRTPYDLGLAFLFFRFWDICKIFPADWLEKIPAPWGVFLDDIVAITYTALCLLLIG